MYLKAIVVAAVVSIAAACSPGGTSQQASPPATGTRPAPVHSAADLDRYLKDMANAPSPLDRLSPLARKRFLDSLEFRNGALAFYDPRDLAAELTADEIRQVLEIFGEEPYEYLLELARPAPRTTPPPAEPAIVERRFDTFIRVANSLPTGSERQRYRSIAKTYDELFAEYAGKAGELDDYDFEFVFRAARTNVFYNPTPEYAHSARKLLAQAQSRSLSRQTDFDDVYKALIGARLFDEAREFAGKHPSPDRKPLPELRDARGPAAPTAWTVNTDKRELIRQSIDLDRPVQVIVVSAPDCHFSQDAARDIRNDPVLAELFREHAIWLNPPLGMTDFDSVQAWNREHPDQPMVIAYAKEDWPMFENWDTPNFYIFKDGQLVETVTGWRAENGREALVETLEKIGLLQGDADPT